VIGKNASLRLAELFCARLCHDMAGPVGTLLGAMEILREEAPDSEEAALAEEAAVDVADRLKLLRAAWGWNAEELDPERLKSLVAGVAAKRKVLLDFDRLAEGMVFTPEAARVVLNLVLLAVESLPGGGVVVLCGNNEGSVLLTISGARAAWPSGLASWLLDDGAAWEAIGLGAHNVQGPLTTLLVRENGFRLSMLMPAGAGGEAEALPPLLLELAGA
jgi:histidine phosphotransferase ChpT